MSPTNQIGLIKKEKIMRISTSPSQLLDGEPRTGILIPVSIHDPVELVNTADMEGLTSMYEGEAGLWFLGGAESILVARQPDTAAAFEGNRRATVLAWLHHRHLNEHGMGISGPALLIGPPDEDGAFTSVTEEMVNLLIPTGRVQMQFRDPAVPGPWLPVGQDDDWFAAYQWMLVQVTRARQLQPELEARAVPSLPVSKLEDAAHIGQRHLLKTTKEARILEPTRFLSCTGVDDLAQQIQATRPAAGQGFHWRDLCLINLTDDGEHWLAVRHRRAVPIPPVLPLIEDGSFTALVIKLLSLTRREAAKGKY